MEELPILINDLTVGKVVIQTKPFTKAINAAIDAAFNISTTNDTQFCPFSDGSHEHTNGRGGVGLVYRRQWLPDGWAPGQTGTDPRGDFVKQAWPYERSLGVIAMEGVGVLEALHAANKTITRDLQVLKDNNSTVTVRATTDSESILRHIASKVPVKQKTRRTVPQQLIDRIKEEIQMLVQGHGIKVVVELHWCPRNKVPQLAMADELAGTAMKSGMGYCNLGVEQHVWTSAVKSDMTLEIEPMVAGTAEADDGPTALQNNAIQKSRNERKRKIEDNEESEKPIKKAKLSPANEAKTDSAGRTGRSARRARHRQKYRTPIMPAAWALDPETTIFIYDPKKGELEAKPVARCPFIRDVVLSTMETGERNVFVNDGRRAFSMAQPLEVPWVVKEDIHKVVPLQLETTPLEAIP